MIKNRSAVLEALKNASVDEAQGGRIHGEAAMGRSVGVPTGAETFRFIRMVGLNTASATKIIVVMLRWMQGDVSTVRTGTIFEETRLPLWFWCMRSGKHVHRRKEFRRRNFRGRWKSPTSQRCLSFNDFVTVWAKCIEPRFDWEPSKWKMNSMSGGKPYTIQGRFEKAGQLNIASDSRDRDCAARR